MSYVTSTTYKSATYGGSNIPDAELDSYLQKASDTIDRLTHNQITVKGGFTSLTPFQQNNVTMAVCYQADHMYNYGDVIPGLDSYSIGGNSVKLAANVDMRYSQQSLDYLKETGLTYRGIFNVGGLYP